MEGGFETLRKYRWENLATSTEIVLYEPVDDQR